MDRQEQDIEGKLVIAKGFKPPEALSEVGGDVQTVDSQEQTAPLSSAEQIVVEENPESVNQLTIELKDKSPEELDARLAEQVASVTEAVTAATTQEEADAALVAAEVAAGASPEEAKKKAAGFWEKLAVEMKRRGIEKTIREQIADIKDGNMGTLLKTFFGSSVVDNGGGRTSSERRESGDKIDGNRFQEYLVRNGKLVPEYVVGAIREAYSGDYGMNVPFDEVKLKRAENDGQALKEVVVEFYSNFKKNPNDYNWDKAQNGLAFWLVYKREKSVSNPSFDKDSILERLEKITDKFEDFYDSRTEEEKKPGAQPQVVATQTTSTPISPVASAA